MFGQIVIGLANSGKSTFCHTVGEYLIKEGRNVKYINLDPGVLTFPYKCDINIKELVCVDQIMNQEGLGINGSLDYAMEFLFENICWLDLKLSELPNDSYLIIDLPGQTELYTQNEFIKKIIGHYSNPKTFNYKFTCVFLAESFYCQSPKSYMEIIISNLIMMLNLGLPQINIFSKSKLLSKENLAFNIESFLEVKNLEYLIEMLPNRKSGVLKKYYRRIVDMIVDLPWFGFSLYDYEDEESIRDVISQIDSANGYIVKQKFVSLLDQKNIESEKELDKAADELVDKFF